MFRPSGATSFDTGRSLRSGRRAGAGPRVVLRGKHFTHHGLDHHPITGARPRPAPRHQLGMPLRLLEGNESDDSVVPPAAVRLGHAEGGGPAGRDP